MIIVRLQLTKRMQTESQILQIIYWIFNNTSWLGINKNYNNINKAEEGKMMPKRRNNRYIREQEIQSSLENQTEHRYLENSQIQELYESYSRMKTFTEVKDEQTQHSADEIITKYCDRMLNFDLSPKNVMDILDKRIQRMLKNKRHKKNWSEEDTKILLWTYTHYANRHGIRSVDQTKEEDWVNISKLIPGSNADSCMFKILSLKKVKLAEKKWTQMEEKLLSQIVKHSSKKNWRIISQQLFKANNQRNKIFRNAKQCKQHWVCYLNPDLRKGPWDIEEDKNLMEYVFVNNGVKKWAEIAKIFRGRTQNALKNRFTLVMERMKKENPSIPNELELIQLFLKKIDNRQTNSNTKRSPIRNKPENQIQPLQIVQEPERIPEDTMRGSQIRNQAPQQLSSSQNFQMIMGDPSYFQSSIGFYQFCIPNSHNCIWVFKNE